LPKKAAAGCQKEIEAAAKHRGVGVVEVQVVDIKIVSIYKNGGHI
jgi:hypothetical protein